MTPVTALLVGAGSRGRNTFGAFALGNPELLQFVAVAEPDEGRRNRFAEDHGISSENCFASWEEALARPQLAPIAVNATLDRTHLPSSRAILAAGYHMLLEKPMATSPEECLEIARLADEHNRLVQICHPLRFTTFYLKVKELLEQGLVGRILSMSMAENVGYWHFAHSFVRGNWRRVDETGPLILTKCCHDMDLATWLADGQVNRVSSFGKLEFFRPKSAPEGAADRCLDNCPAADVCGFYAPGLYMGDETEWPVDVISLDTSLEARTEAVRTGPYGRCVFKCDNTTVDQQAVIAEFDNGVLLDFSVRGASFHPGRTIRIEGTLGELNGYFEKNEIKILRYGHGTGEGVEPLVYTTEPATGSHGGGDDGAIRNFLHRYKTGDAGAIRRSLDIAVEGHLLAFAAEKARESGQTVDMSRFRTSFQPAN